MHRIHVLKCGLWPCSAGMIAIDEQVISDVLSSYSPSHYAAPLTITHQLPPGTTERSLPLAGDLTELSEARSHSATLSPNALAYGSPVRLERRRDGGVDAVFDRISPCWLEWARNKNLLSVSPGLYRPTDAGNPTPGRWHLKHVAGLGAESPAQKGMTALSSGLAPVGLSAAVGGVEVWHKKPVSLADALASARARSLCAPSQP